MKRRDFLGKLLPGAAAVVAVAVLPKQEPVPLEPEKPKWAEGGYVSGDFTMFNIRVDNTGNTGSYRFLGSCASLPLPWRSPGNIGT